MSNSEITELQKAMDEMSAVLRLLSPDFTETLKMLMSLDLSQSARQRFVRMAGHDIVAQAHAAVFWDVNAWKALKLRQLARDLQALEATRLAQQADLAQPPQSSP